MDLHSAFLALGGGVLIGLAAIILLLFNGRIAGISNIVVGLWPVTNQEAGWRIAFVLGLLAGGVTLSIAQPQVFGELPRHSLTLWALSGFLVGYGARLANGCTSGHGVCGLSRRSLRSLTATATFMVTGMITVYLVHHVLQ